jgi:hypothetical protein
MPDYADIQSALAVARFGFASEMQMPDLRDAPLAAHLASDMSRTEVTQAIVEFHNAVDKELELNDYHKAVVRELFELAFIRELWPLPEYLEQRTWQHIRGTEKDVSNEF